MAVSVPFARRRAAWVLAAGVSTIAVPSAWAADALAANPMADMPGMTMPGMTVPGMTMPGMTVPGMAMPGMAMDHAMHMAGALGGYSMMRDASGTSWQPDTTPMMGVGGMFENWSTMLQGSLFVISDHQGGARGGDKVFGESMFMGMAQRALAGGTLTLHGMLSLDPLMGKDGYPLLLQTGETANGVSPLIDRQHPHDFLMELAASFAVPLDDRRSFFVYAGYPGEPALGPTTFMHRFSGMDIPEAPLGHHWLDSTHVTFGVATAGLVWEDWKFEASAFNGREPDQHRWNFDSLRLDSGSVRATWNPTQRWSYQISWGYIHSPESLEPNVDQHRTTASATYNVPLAEGNWQTVLAWGMNDKGSAGRSNAFLLESALGWRRHTVFARAENDEKDELFETGDPLYGRTFRVSKLSIGYIYDIPLAAHLKLGLGALGSAYDLPRTLKPAYGGAPTSYMLFTRLALR